MRFNIRLFSCGWHPICDSFLWISLHTWGRWYTHVSGCSTLRYFGGWPVVVLFRRVRTSNMIILSTQKTYNPGNSTINRNINIWTPRSVSYIKMLRYILILTTIPIYVVLGSMPAPRSCVLMYRWGGVPYLPYWVTSVGSAWDGGLGFESPSYTTGMGYMGSIGMNSCAVLLFGTHSPWSWSHNSTHQQPSSRSRLLQQTTLRKKYRCLIRDQLDTRIFRIICELKVPTQKSNIDRKLSLFNLPGCENRQCLYLGLRLTAWQHDFTGYSMFLRVIRPSSKGLSTHPLKLLRYWPRKREFSHQVTAERAENLHQMSLSQTLFSLLIKYILIFGASNSTSTGIEIPL